MDKRPLRLALLLDSCQVPAWAYHALERVVLSGCGNVVAVAASDSQDKRTSALRALWQGRSRLLYHAFDALDRRLFCREPDALRPMDVRKLFPGVPVHRLAALRWRHEGQLAAADVAWIGEQRLDILLALGAEVPRGDVLQAATYGIWLYDWGSRETGPPGLWEVVRGRPETTAALCMLGGQRHDRRELCRVSCSTFPYSPARNRQNCLWAASSFLPRQIERLHRLGADEFFLKTTGLGQTPELDSHWLRGAPSDGATLRLAARLCARNLVELGRRAVYLDQWYLLFHLAEGRPTPLVPPKDRFWADPHVIRTGDTYHVFLEEYLYNAGKGRISVMQIDDRGTVTGPTPVLEEEHHLSYPSVFSWEGRYYMVPESAHRRTIDLYEGIEFPWKWQFRMHLMENVRAVDSTIFSHQGTWWLFTGIAEHEGAFPQVELFLFFSNELFTNRWQPHPMNPIVSDVKRARPAGSVFSQGGRIIRPSQDCSRRYGYGFDLNEIVALSETEYAERPLASVRPRSHSRALATHTYARDGRLTMIDACMRRSRLF